MDVTQAIEQRHSVRRFTDKPIEGEALAALEDAISRANAASGLHLQLVRDSPGAFRGLLARRRFDNVQNYVACIGPKSPDLDELCGYFGEKVVLAAQQAGLSTCWVGGTFGKRKVKADIAPGERLVIVIAVGYAAAEGCPHRSKPLSELSHTHGPETPDWFRRGMRAAALAPTAMNQQHFLFTLGADGEIVTRRSTGGFFSNVDLGIVTLHFELASGHSVSGTVLDRR